MMKDLTTAGLEANLEHWKCLAARYRAQRENAMDQVHALQALLLERTGRAYDGHDYLRVIKETRHKASWRNRLRNLWGAVRSLR